MSELSKSNIENASDGVLQSNVSKSQIDSFFALVIERVKNEPAFYPNGLRHVIIGHNILIASQIRSLGEYSVLLPNVNREENATASETRQDSGTAERDNSKKEDIGLQIDKLLNTTREVTFEDGLGAEFYGELESIIKEYRKDAILALYYRIMISKQFDPEIAAETLNWLGTVECPDTDTHNLRLWLLEEGLKHFSPGVREGATIGLSRLNDPKSIPFLESAAKKEQRRLLRKEMDKVIGRLNRTHHAAVSQGNIKSQ
jgi:hypothetical protein